MTIDPATIGQVGRYELIERLGAGGMGEVFLARATGTAGFEKRVVIKTILPHLAGDEAFVHRFIDEGKLVVQLRHANIAQVLDMGEDDGITYLAMEFVDGRDLRELFRLARAADKPLPVEVVVTILIKVLEALDYAHHITDDDGRHLDIIHRDVSPSNVMVSRSGEVKLVDFGIARAADRLGHSVSGSVKGKFSYMSPQQARGGKLDGRSDQFSVGVMAWELLAGSRPFDGDTDFQTLDRIRQADPGSLEDACPTAPPEVVAAVDRMLQKQPEGRFEDAGEAAKALQSYLFRTESMVGAREISAWVADVIALLPPDKRGRPGAPLSLDDALRLSLGDSLGSFAAPATGTVSVPGDLAPQAAIGAGLQLEIPATVPAGDLVPAPPAPDTQTNTQTNTATAVGAQTRGRLVGLLVLLNLLLLAAVGTLIWQLADDDEPSPSARVAPTEPTPVSPAVADLAPAATEVATKASGDSTPVATEPSANASTEPPTSAGDEIGKELAGLELPLEAPAARPAAPAPERPRTGPAKVSDAARSAAAAKRAATKAKQERKAAPAADPGSVRFRYFPASAKVSIDGKSISTGGSNRVDVELGPGGHNLRLTAGPGRVLTRSFRVTSGKITNLATLTVPEATAEEPK